MSFWRHSRVSAWMGGSIGWVRAHEHVCLALLLLLALMIRLPFLPGNADIIGDMKIYRVWAESIHRRGLTTIYDTPGVDYPPLLLYLLGGMSWLLTQLPAALTAHGAAQNALLKLPAVLADILTTWLIVWALGSQTLERRLAAGLLYAITPAIWYVSAIWGQTDAIYTLFLVAAITTPPHGTALSAWIAYALALGTKAQSLFLAPLMITITLARHGMRGLVRGVAAGAIAGIVLTAPWLFSGRIGLVMQRYTLPDTRSQLDVSAYNLWYLVRRGQITRFWGTQLLPGLPISYRALGLGLYASFVLLIVGLVWRQPQRLWPLAAALLNLGMFMLLPQMHERYMFPTLALLLLSAGGWTNVMANTPALSTSKRLGLWWAYGLLASTFLINLVIISRLAPLARTNRVVTWPHTPLSEALQVLALAAALVNVLVLSWLSLLFAMG